MENRIAAYMLQAALGFAASGMPCPSVAAEAGDLDAEVFLGEVPMFLTVTRLPQSLSQTPASVMTIDREMIEAAGVVEVADLLRLVPGFVTGHYQDADGARTVVSYYGFSDQYARRLQVLVDGMSVYMPATGGVEWNDLPVALGDIERIEVVRGPNGAAYGSNSFLGVINIITRHPRDSENSASVMAGTLGYREGSVRLASGDEKFRYRLTGGYRSSEGYRDTRDTGRVAVNDDSITRSLVFRGDYRSSVNDYWTFQGGYANGPREVGFDKGDQLDPRRFQQMQTDYQQVHWRRMLDSEREVQVQLSRNHHMKSDKFQTAPLSAILSAELGVTVLPGDVPFYLPGVNDQPIHIDTSLESTRQNVEATYRFNPFQDWRTVVGGEYRIDEVAGESYFDQGGRFTNKGYRLFFNGEWQPDRMWTINIGDLYEKNNFLDGRHSPRLSFARKLGGTHFVRATASRAYRIPAFAEEKLDFTFRLDDGTLLHRLYDSEGNIDPERIDNLELALAADSGAFSYELKAFRNDVTALTSAARNSSASFLPDSWLIKTGGEMKIEGGEFQMTLRPRPDLLVAAGVARAYANGWRLADISSGYHQDISDSVPETTFSALISKRFGGGDRVGIAYYSVSPVHHLSGNLTKGVTTADLNYIHRFNINKYKASVQVLFRDIGDSYYDFETETRREYQAFIKLAIAP